jgi:hypothetical protein
MTLDKRLAALVAALDAREQEAALTTEQMEEQVAQLVQFMGSDLFNPDTDVIAEPSGSHTGEGCQRCLDTYQQAVTVELVATIASASSTNREPITETEWRSRGRWWPNTADITCLTPTFALLAMRN